MTRGHPIIRIRPTTSFLPTGPLMQFEREYGRLMNGRQGAYGSRRPYSGTKQKREIWSVGEDLSDVGLDAWYDLSARQGK